MPRSQRTHNTTKIVQSIAVPISQEPMLRDLVPQLKSVSGWFPANSILDSASARVCSLEHTLDYFRAESIERASLALGGIRILARYPRRYFGRYFVSGVLSKLRLSARGLNCVHSCGFFADRSVNLMCTDNEALRRWANIVKRKAGEQGEVVPCR